MQITLNIVAENPQELQEAVQGLSASYSGTVVVQEEKKKQPKQDSDVKETKKAPEKETEKAAEDVPTLVELRAKAQEVGKTAEGKKAVKALLDEFECKNISTIPEDKRAEFMARLEEL